MWRLQKVYRYMYIGRVPRRWRRALPISSAPLLRTHPLSALTSVADDLQHPHRQNAACSRVLPLPSSSIISLRKFNERNETRTCIYIYLHAAKGASRRVSRASRITSLLLYLERAGLKRKSRAHTKHPPIHIARVQERERETTKERETRTLRRRLAAEATTRPRRAIGRPAPSWAGARGKSAARVGIKIEPPCGGRCSPPAARALYTLWPSLSLSRTLGPSSPSK